MEEDVRNDRSSSSEHADYVQEQEEEQLNDKPESVSSDDTGGGAVGGISGVNVGVKADLGNLPEQVKKGGQKLTDSVRRVGERATKTVTGQQDEEPNE
jgi:hypothetical protein